jgi:tRNA(Ile)-lysidine synthase
MSVTNMIEPFYHNLRRILGEDPQNRRFLLAVSGGQDSVIMADLFFVSGIPFGIAHCNYQLRGEDSDLDLLFVQNLAAQYVVPFYQNTFDTKNIAAQKKQSIQVVARQLRYDWLEEIRALAGYDHICTAHHLNDTVETILYNLIKGTGLKGLTGIPEKNGYVLRPLLFAAKKDLLKYYQSAELSHREDYSNSETSYARNQIRHKVIPPLREINPSLEHTMGRNLGYWREIRQWFEVEAEKLRGEWVEESPGRISIDLERLCAHPASSSLLHFWLQADGFFPEQLENILHAYHNGAKSRIFLSPTHRALLYQQHLIIEEQFSGQGEFFLLETENGQLENPALSWAMQTRPNAFSTVPHLAFFSPKGLIFPLKLRHWQAGDLFCPLGMGGKAKKLQDYFSDEKIDRFARERTWILCNGDGQLMWVLGKRVDERFKVQEGENEVLRVTLGT